MAVTAKASDSSRSKKQARQAPPKIRRDLHADAADRDSPDRQSASATGGSSSGLSHLSKLQHSLFFEPGKHFERIEAQALGLEPLLSKSCHTNKDLLRVKKKKRKKPSGERLHACRRRQPADTEGLAKPDQLLSTPDQIDVSLSSTRRAAPVSRLARPSRDAVVLQSSTSKTFGASAQSPIPIRDSQETALAQQQLNGTVGGEQPSSLVIFTPKEEAMLDRLSFQGPLVAQLAGQNERLGRELAEARELLDTQKRLLEQALEAQSAKVQSCAQTGSQLLGRCQTQAEYLQANRQLLDTSQISMLTTMDEIGAAQIQLPAIAPLK